MEKKKLSKKKIVIISIIVVLVIAILITSILIIFKKDKKKPKEKDTFGDIVSKRAKDGSLNKRIETGLLKYEIEPEYVKLMGIDIDSDNDKELVVYAEDEKNKIFIQLDVDMKDKSIDYQETYPANSFDSLKYVYSIKDDENYWSIEYGDDRTIISDKDTLVTSENFDNDYYVITNEYNEGVIFENATFYYLKEKEVSANELNEASFTNKELLKDNGITQKEVKESAEKYQKERKEKQEEEKKKEEEEKKQEEEKKKQEQTNNTFTVEGKILKYGKYTAVEKIVYDNLIINRDKTAVLDGKGCSWSKTTHDFAQDSSTAGHPKECIVVTCTDETIYLMALNNDELSDGDIFDFKYSG